MKIKTKKIYISFVCILLMFFSFLYSISLPKFQVFASSTSNFETTNVLDDLLSADEEFTTKYPYNTEVTSKIQLIQIVEYGYSNDEDLRDNYGLYVYLYNPTKMKIVKNSKSNQIQIGVAYDTNPITKDSKVTSYEKFDLKFCSVSTGEFDELYYKFRIVDKVGTDGKTIEQRVNAEYRRYDISGIEIFENGKSNAEDYGVGGTYSFTGYAKGFNANDRNADSTLQGKIDILETIDLEVEHTYYRTETSAKGVGYQNQIDTVYFSVPNEYFNKYGKLQKIKAQWYEFLTTDIVVIDDDRTWKILNGEIQNYQNSIIGNSSVISLADEFNYHYYIDTTLQVGGSGGEVQQWYWADDWLYHSGFGATATTKSRGDNFERVYGIDYMFKCTNMESYDPHTTNISNGAISGTDLELSIFESSQAEYNETLEMLDWVKSREVNEYYTQEEKDEDIARYENSLVNDFVPIQNGVYKYLFQQDIQENRKVNNEYGVIQYGGDGASVYEFDLDIDKLSWDTWSDVEHSFWENSDSWGFWNTLFGNLPTDTGMKDVEPIYILQDSDLTGSTETISDSLVVNYNDVAEIKSFYNTAKANNEKVVLFRFAVSDYFSTFIDSLEPLGYSTNNITNDCGYRARETIFMDFDIISLTFNDNGTFYTIPVVADPINIINDITPPYELPEIDFLKLILGLLMLILLIVLLYPFLPIIFNILWSVIKFIFKILIWIISLPFKFLKWLFKSRNKKYK